MNLEHIYASPTLYWGVWGRSPHWMRHETKALIDVAVAAGIKAHRIVELGAGVKSRYYSHWRRLAKAKSRSHLFPHTWHTADYIDEVPIDLLDPHLSAYLPPADLYLAPFNLLGSITHMDYTPPTVDEICRTIDNIPGTILGTILPSGTIEGYGIDERFTLYRGADISRLSAELHHKFSKETIYGHVKGVVTPCNGLFPMDLHVTLRQGAKIHRFVPKIPFVVVSIPAIQALNSRGATWYLPDGTTSSYLDPYTNDPYNAYHYVIRKG